MLGGGDNSLSIFNLTSKSIPHRNIIIYLFSDRFFSTLCSIIQNGKKKGERGCQSIPTTSLRYQRPLIIKILDLTRPQDWSVLCEKSMKNVWEKLGNQCLRSLEVGLLVLRPRRVVSQWWDIMELWLVRRWRGRGKIKVCIKSERFHEFF